MKHKIERIIQFDAFKLEGWVFRVSISNSENFMVLCFEQNDPSNFIIRFFTDEDTTDAFIHEASMGKHQS